jgi:hypothetical protein
MRSATPGPSQHAAKTTKPHGASTQNATSSVVQAHPKAHTTTGPATGNAGANNPDHAVANATGTGSLVGGTPAAAGTGPSAVAEHSTTQAPAPTTTGSSPAASAPAPVLGSIASLLPGSLGGVSPSVGYGSGFSGYGHHSGYGYGHGSGYRGPYRSGYGRRNYVAMSSQARNRMLRLQRLIADLNALSPGAAVGAANRTTLRNDLWALSQGANRPAHAAVQSLAGDLTTALPGRSRPLLDTVRLAGDLETVVNGPHLPSGTVQHAVNDARSVLRSSGVGAANLQAVVASMQTVGVPGALGNGFGPGLANQLR